MVDFGISNTELSWFESYLHKRSQVVKCHSKLSTVKHLNIGVPQGTILGPILFNFYINELPKVLSNSNITGYADDFTLDSSAKTIGEAQCKLQKSVDLVSDWLTNNGLIINASKSKCMLIGSIQNIKNSELNIKINNISLEQTSSFKLLGLTIDSTLSFSEHTHILRNCISSKLSIITRLKYVLPINIISILYDPFIQSHIDYALTIWGTCAHTNLEKIQSIQRRAARIFLNDYNPDSNSNDLIKQLNWMTVAQRRDYMIAILLYKIIQNHNNINSAFNISFNFATDVHNYNTRFAAANSIHLPKARTNYYKRSLSFNGAKIYNSLPSHLFDSVSINSFKARCKQMLKNRSST
jgi:hypothetical protein